MCKFLDIAVIYVSVITLMFSQTVPAYAGLIGTEQFMDQQLVELDRETIGKVLNRDEARTLLEKHGVSNEQAQERIDALTDEEVRVVAQKFEALPAAGDGGGIILGLLVIVLVFIILDLAKVTNVFKSI
jgi:hypothetical protein